MNKSVLLRTSRVNTGLLQRNNPGGLCLVLPVAGALECNQGKGNQHGNLHARYRQHAARGVKSHGNPLIGQRIRAATAAGQTNRYVCEAHPQSLLLRAFRAPSHCLCGTSALGQALGVDTSACRQYEQEYKFYLKPPARDRQAGEERMPNLPLPHGRYVGKPNLASASVSGPYPHPGGPRPVSRAPLVTAKKAIVYA